MGEAARGTQLDLQPLKGLADEVVRQYHEFSEFDFLFYGSQDRVDLLNAVASTTSLESSSGSCWIA